MTLEQKINILYYIYQSRIEELIFKSIFDYFEADKFYVITEKEDRLKDFTIEYKEYELSDYFRYIEKNDYPNLYNLFMSKYNELLEKKTNKNLEDYIDNIFAFLQRDDLYYDHGAISCNNSADLNIHTILEDTVLNKTFLVIKEQKLKIVENNLLSIDINKYKELYDLYKTIHQKVVDIFLWGKRNN